MYCQGGHEIIVFVVVIPNPSQHHFSTVVVKNNCHQLPIGTVCFDSSPGRIRVRLPAVTELPWLKSSLYLKRLRHEVEEKTKANNEASIREKIIHNTIQNNLDVASDLYSRNKGLLQVASKKEISWYVRTRLDNDLIFYYFPDLPAPMDNVSRATVPLLTREEATFQLPEARDCLSEEERRQDTNIRSMIVHYILHNMVDSASIFYIQNKSILQDGSKREISRIVTTWILDKGLISRYFPDLPTDNLMSLPLEDFNEGLKDSQQPNADSPPSAAHVSTAPAPNRCPHRGF
jgi:hypothetical protein